MSDVIKYPLSAAIELCEQFDNDETNYHLKMLEYKGERDTLKVALETISNLAKTLKDERDEARAGREAYKQLAIKHAQERDEAREEVKLSKAIIDLIKKDLT